MHALQVDGSLETILSGSNANPAVASSTGSSANRIAAESRSFAERMESLLSSIEAEQHGNDHGVRVTRALLHNFLDAMIDLARDADCRR